MDTEHNLTAAEFVALENVSFTDGTLTEYAVIHYRKGQPFAAGPYATKAHAEGLADSRQGVVVERRKAVVHGPWTLSE